MATGVMRGVMKQAGEAAEGGVLRRGLAWLSQGVAKWPAVAGDRHPLGCGVADEERSNG